MLFSHLNHHSQNAYARSHDNPHFDGNAKF
jgi:hypothetical protein